MGAAVLEITGSWLSGSLALLSDAGHVGTDAIALGLTLWSLRVSRRPHTPRMSFGYHRMEVLAALANALLLLGIASYLATQAYERYLTRPQVSWDLMFLIGLAGLGANLIMLALLRGWARKSINVRGAFLHTYGDTLGSVGVVAGALLIQLTGNVLFDVLVALLVSALLVVSGVRLLRDSLRIVLEASPAGFTPEAVAAAIGSVPGVRGIHDLHIWTVTSGFLALTGHILVAGDTTVQEASRVVEAVESILRERFGIAHVTLQVDSAESGRIPPSDLLRPR
jgi:cobalt-zinc-cadmium efflux system protein